MSRSHIQFAILLIGISFHISGWSQSMVWTIDEKTASSEVKPSIQMHIRFANPLTEPNYAQKIENQNSQAKLLMEQACMFNIPEATSCKVVEVSAPESSESSEKDSPFLAERRDYFLQAEASSLASTGKMFVAILQSGYTYYDRQKACAELPRAEVLNYKACQSQCQSECEKVYAEKLDLAQFLELQMPYSFFWFDSENVRSSDPYKAKECVHLVKHYCKNP